MNVHVRGVPAYVCLLEADVDTCAARTTHGWPREQLDAMAATLAPNPPFATTRSLSSLDQPAKAPTHTSHKHKEIYE